MLATPYELELTATKTIARRKALADPNRCTSPNLFPAFIASAGDLSSQRGSDFAMAPCLPCGLPADYRRTGGQPANSQDDDDAGCCSFLSWCRKKTPGRQSPPPRRDIEVEAGLSDVRLEHHVAGYGHDVSLYGHRVQDNIAHQSRRHQLRLKLLDLGAGLLKTVVGFGTLIAVVKTVGPELNKGGAAAANAVGIAYFVLAYYH